MKFSIKLITLMTIILIINGILISYFVYNSNVKELNKEIKGNLEDYSFHVIDKVDRNMYGRAGDIQILATDPIISSRNSTPEQITERLIKFRDTYKYYISLSFFDINRIRIADTAGIDIGKQNELEKYFIEASQGNISAASDIKFSSTFNMPIIYFASSVRDSDGKIFGFVTSRMPVSKLNEMLLQMIGTFERKNPIQIDLVDKNGLLLFSNKNAQGVLKEKLKLWEDIEEGLKKDKIGSGVHTYQGEKEELFYVFIKEFGYLDFKGNEWTLVTHLSTKDIYAPARALRNKIIFIFFGITLAFVLIVFIFSRSITNPLKRLYSATKELEKLNYKARVDIQTGDEFEELGKAFNDTAEALEKVDEERKQIDSAKTQFLSITSHELRSPMTPMKAQLQMLEENFFGKLNQKQKESVEIVLRNTERLDNIIKDFLEISRIEAARLKFNFVKTDLRKPILRVIEEMKGFLPEKNIKIISKIDKLPVIDVDSDRIMQVLRNLINNAKKFSPKNTKVLVRVERKKEGLLFSVKDQGIGIKPEDQKRIFEPFYQEEQTIYREYGGAGLGLAICKGIVEAQGGKIWFESEYGKGSTFYFKIPFNPSKKIKPIKLLFSNYKS